MQHIQKEHPWLNWSIETSKKHFEEEIRALEDNNMEELEHDPIVSKKCPKYPTKKWIIERFARSVTNNDVTAEISGEIEETSGENEGLKVIEITNTANIITETSGEIEGPGREEANSQREIKKHKKTDDAD